MKLCLESRTAVQKIAVLLVQANAEFQKLSAVEQQLVFEHHNEGSSLNHCLRWGTQAAEEIVAATR